MSRRPLIGGKDLAIGVLLATVVYLAASQGKIVVQPIIDLSKLNKGGPAGDAISSIGRAILGA